MFSLNRARLSGVTKNYAKLDPLTAGSAVTINADGVTMSTSQYGSCIANFGKTSGRWYFEAKCVDASQKATLVGLVNGAMFNKNTYPGAPNNGACYYFYDGSKYFNNATTAFAPNPAYNEWVGIYFDAGAKTMGVISNGIDRGLLATGMTGELFPIFGNGSSVKSGSQVINFGATPFVFEPPPLYNKGYYLS
jgi:hypothetical protein